MYCPGEGEYELYSTKEEIEHLRLKMLYKKTYPGMICKLHSSPRYADSRKSLAAMRRRHKNAEETFVPEAQDLQQCQENYPVPNTRHMFSKT